MNTTIIGNEALAYVFDEVNFSSKNKKNNKRSNSFNEIEKMYNLDKIAIPTKGQIVLAKYIGMTSRQYVFSVSGYKDEIRIDNRLSESKYLKNLNIGDEIDVLISDVDNNNFMIKGSVSSIYESKAHADLKSIYEGTPVKAFIKSLNPAGYEVEILHKGVTLPAFMPNTLAGINKLYDPNIIVGETFDVMVESYSVSEGTYIVSRRKYLQTLIPEAIKQLYTNTVYTGRVTGTTPFGVFVEFNECLTGMIHKANIDEAWVDKFDTIKPGFLIDFYIKEIFKDKIILTQNLKETLWDTIKTNQIIEGTIKDTKIFGVLVNLDEETVGLIPSSKLEKNVKYNNGDKIKVKVTDSDRSVRKIYLAIAK